MLRAILVSATLAGGIGGATGGLIAQAGAPVSSDVTSALIGSLIGSSPSGAAAAVLLWQLRRANQMIDEKDDELKAMYRLVLDGTERMAPVLAEATRTLAEVRAGMEATVRRPPTTEIDRVVRSLQHVVDELDRRTG